MYRAVWICALGACTFITNAELDAQRLNIDEDRDGVSIGEGDCDDTDPLVFPGQPDIPYDGIDNDCGGDGDEVDVDGDGQVAVEAKGEDCDDTDPEIGVGMPDPPYDGVDSDCARDNDFDADGDGFMGEPATEEAVAAYEKALGIEIPRRFGDCDDDDPEINPGADEIPYDGIDSDCDGADDFDADGDGVTYPTDCLDLPDDELPIDPARVYPGADDLPYDGVDADCARDNDFDTDADGFVRTVDLAAYRRYEEFYDLTFDAQPGDCDDQIDTVNPEGLEVLGDGRDENCDGQPNQGTFTFGGLSLEDARAPHLVSTPDGFVLAAGVSRAVLPSETVDNAIVMALLPSEPDVRTLPLVADAVLASLDDPPGPGLGLAATPGGVALGFVRPSGGSLLAELGERPVSSGGFGAFTSEVWPWALPEPPILASVQVIGGLPRLLTCAGSEVGLVAGGELGSAVASGPLVSCFHEPDGVTVACTEASCTEWSDTALSIEAANPSPPVVAVRQRSDVRAEVLRNVTGVRLVADDGTTNRVLPATQVVQADAVLLDGTQYVVAITDVADLVMIWGPPGGPYQTATLGAFDPARPALEPIAATIAGHGTRVIVAVSLSDGVDSGLAWSVLGR